jgi:ketohexokinase/beta-glucosidase
MDGAGYALRIIPLIADEITPGMHWMHDNSSVHTSNDATRELERRGLTPMSWPANSPDLNPIEAIWFKMQQRIKAYTDRPTRIQAL